MKHWSRLQTTIEIEHFFRHYWDRIIWARLHCKVGGGIQCRTLGAKTGAQKQCVPKNRAIFWHTLIYHKTTINVLGGVLKKNPGAPLFVLAPRVLHWIPPPTLQCQSRCKKASLPDAKRHRFYSLYRVLVFVCINLNVFYKFWTNSCPFHSINCICWFVFFEFFQT